MFVKNDKSLEEELVMVLIFSKVVLFESLELTEIDLLSKNSTISLNLILFKVSIFQV